jgi:hypothetical protein
VSDAILSAAALISGERIRSTMALSSVETGALALPVFVFILVIFMGTKLHKISELRKYYCK